MKKMETIMDVYKEIAGEAETLKEEGETDVSFKLYWVMSLLEQLPEINPPKE